MIQTGGVNSVSGSGNFYMANIGGSSRYSLSGTGTLELPDDSDEIIGNGGTATFNQTGGTNEVNAGIGSGLL